jgi:CheY-like chemotaxis protein
VLRSAGFEVLVGDVAEALELLAHNEQPIDLLVTDVRLPGMNGRELARRGQALRPVLRVVLMSGHLDEMSSEPGPALPHLLEKPLSPAVLVRVVRELLEV